MKTTILLGAVALLAFTGDITAQDIPSHFGKNAEAQLIKSKPRLGRTLEELELIWGKGIPMTVDHIFIFQKWADGDRDHGMYRDIKKDCSAIQWRFPDIKDFYIKGLFWNGVCVAIDTRCASPAEAVKLAGQLIPRVKFPTKIPVKNQNFVTYSTSPNGKYKLLFHSHRWIALSDSGYIKSVLAERENERKRQEAEEKARRDTAVRNTL